MKDPKRKAFGQEEHDMVQECLAYYLNSNEDFPYDGKYQKEFESMFSEKMGSGFSLATNSGSSAAYVALMGLELPRGSTVLMSPVTDTSSYMAIILAGLNPVIVDTQIDSYNACFDSFKRAYSIDVSAIYLVHSYGSPVDAESVSDYCELNNIKLIEDCSQSPFAKTEKGHIVGTIGDVGVFSTMYRKSVQTCSSGGVVYTKNAELYEKLVEYSDRGRPKSSTNYDFRQPGNCRVISHNFNTNELSCAIGIGSLKRISDTIKKRTDIVSKLSKNIVELTGGRCKPMKFVGHPSPFLLPIILDGDSKLKDKLYSNLKQARIPFVERYNCYAYDWNIVRNTKRSIVANIARLPKKWVYDTNARKLHANTCNIFINEAYTDEYIAFILDCFREF